MAFCVHLGTDAGVSAPAAPVSARLAVRHSMLLPSLLTLAEIATIAPSIATKAPKTATPPRRPIESVSMTNLAQCVLKVCWLKNQDLPQTRFIP